VAAPRVFWVVLLAVDLWLFFHAGVQGQAAPKRREESSPGGFVRAAAAAMLSTREAAQD
jgi:hypothetical protein